jgi:hypothetical protein
MRRQSRAEKATPMLREVVTSTVRRLAAPGNGGESLA